MSANIYKFVPPHAPPQVRSQSSDRLPFLIKIKTISETICCWLLLIKGDLQIKKYILSFSKTSWKDWSHKFKQIWRKGSPFCWQVKLRLEGQVCFVLSSISAVNRWRCPTELKDFIKICFFFDVRGEQDIIYDSRCRWILIKHTRILLLTCHVTKDEWFGSYSNFRSIVFRLFVS